MYSHFFEGALLGSCEEIRESLKNHLSIRYISLAFGFQ